jgi:hypothetical protein
MAAVVGAEFPLTATTTGAIVIGRMADEEAGPRAGWAEGGLPPGMAWPAMPELVGWTGRALSRRPRGVEVSPSGAGVGVEPSDTGTVAEAPPSLIGRISPPAAGLQDGAAGPPPEGWTLGGPPGWAREAVPISLALRVERWSSTGPDSLTSRRGSEAAASSLPTVTRSAEVKSPGVTIEAPEWLSRLLDLGR